MGHSIKIHFIIYEERVKALNNKKPFLLKEKATRSAPRGFWLQHRKKFFEKIYQNRDFTKYHHLIN